MTHERDHVHALTPSGPTADLDAALAPGRAGRTDGLIGPHGPRPTGLLMRKAAGSVSPDADQAVGAAASATGHQLPDALRTKFESSLGTDLSSVRVHTGATSAGAASAVGAKAYATGNDIHFGAGHYDPASSGGQELLAHEVAHTVQQRGGSSQRQHKLEVSSPGDHAEVEADRAASAMVSGAPFSLAGASLGLARKKDDKPKEKGKKEEDKKWPMVKDSSISGDVLDGELGLSWKDGYEASWKKKGGKVEKKKDFRSEFEIATGIVGFVSGGLEASLGTSLTAKASVSSQEAPPPNASAMKMTIAASGTGKVEAKVGGSVKVGVGVGAANLLSITGGAKLELEASAAINVTGGGEVTAVGDAVTGTISFGAAGEIDVKGTGSIDIDVNLVGKEHTIASFELGSVSLLKGTMERTSKSTNGQAFQTSDSEVKWTLLPIPAAKETKRTQRPLTPEERRQYMPVDQGASGAGTTAGPETKPMSDTELATAGTAAAMERLSKHKGEVVSVVDPGHPAGAAVSFELDGISYTAAADVSKVDPSADPDAKRPLLRATSAKLESIQASIEASAVSGCKTVGDVVTKILHGGHVTFHLIAVAGDFDKSPKEKRDAEAKTAQWLDDEGRKQAEAKRQSSVNGYDVDASNPESIQD